jgi:carbonic anhydrase/acetyltransferase-like protein (isoleucine patch superfamily)
MSHKYKLLAKEKLLIKLPSREEDGFAPREAYHTLHRVKALVDIPRHGVKAGDIGGYVSNKHILSQFGECWIGRQAIVWGNTKIEGNALVSDTATLFSESDELQLFVTGNAKIDGHSSVEIAEGFSDPDYTQAVIDENVHIFGYAYIRNTIQIFGSAQIYDSAQINDAKYICGEAKIYENAFLLGENSVSGNVEIFGQTIVDKRTIISGNSTIGTSGKILYVPANLKLGDGIMVAPQNKKAAASLAAKNKKAADSLAETKKISKGILRNFGKFALNGTKKNELLAEPYSASSDAQQISVETLDDIAVRIEGYQNDIVKIIKFPLMVDTTDPFTSKMMMLLNKAQRLRSFSDNKQFSETVDALEEAFLAAEANALRLAATRLSENDQKRTAKATDLLRIAMDDAASENEKQIAFKQGLKQLEGIILIPEQAVETFRTKAGIAQLTT